MSALAETLITVFAAVRFIAVVDAGVLLVVEPVRPHAVTEIAHVGCFAAMDFHVPVVGGDVGEFLEAYIALGGGFAIVQPLVAGQVAFFDKRFVAYLAGEGPLAGVDSHVADEVAGFVKALEADVALVRFLACV